jgi:hypothetical protein
MTVLKGDGARRKSSMPEAIDCDVHPSVPDIKALTPYLDEHWRESVEGRGIPSLETMSYPPPGR